jgi:hypothetical protein
VEQRLKRLHDVHELILDYLDEDAERLARRHYGRAEERVE